MTDYSTLQQEVLDFGFADSKFRPYIKTYLNRGVRDAVRRINIRGELVSQSYSTTASVATAVLPADFCRFVDLRNTTDQDLLAPIELRDYDEANASSGKPTQYVVIGTNITFYPTPDAAYSLSLRYQKYPAEMVNGGDENPLGDDYDQALVDYSTARCFQRENDYVAADSHRQMYEQELSRLMGQAHSDVFEGPKQVSGTWGASQGVVTHIAKGDVWR